MALVAASTMSTSCHCLLPVDSKPYRLLLYWLTLLLHSPDIWCLGIRADELLWQADKWFGYCTRSALEAGKFSAASVAKRPFFWDEPRFSPLERQFTLERNRCYDRRRLYVYAAWRSNSILSFCPRVCQWGLSHWRSLHSVDEHVQGSTQNGAFGQANLCTQFQSSAMSCHFCLFTCFSLSLWIYYD